MRRETILARLAEHPNGKLAAAASGAGVAGVDAVLSLHTQARPRPRSRRPGYLRRARWADRMGVSTEHSRLSTWLTRRAFSV
jgi:hypothetical protein